MKVNLTDVEATEALGAALASEAQRGDVFFLRGELGSGKTSLARGFLRRFFGNPELDVPSPSYLLHFAYTAEDSSKPSVSTATPAGDASDGGGGGAGTGAAPASAPKAPAKAFRAGSTSLVPGAVVHHLDPFRLPEGRIAALIDFEAVFSNVALVEWPERLGEQLVTETTPSRLVVTFEGFGPQAVGRSVLLSAVGGRWERLLERWEAEGGPLRHAPSDPHTLADSTGEAAADGGGEGEGHAPQSLSAQPAVPKSASLRNCRPLPQSPREWRVLGIESSCDDTGAAVLSGTGKILGEALASQAGIHQQWGGVVPKLAQEGHKKAIDETVEEALRRAGVAAGDLSAVAVTSGPGLGLCLEVGVRKALQIAAEHRLPLVRVHHMEAHTLVTRLPDQSSKALEESDEVAEALPKFPFVTLLVSGGHNMAVLSRGIGAHTILGSTIDDSIGEAFDKTARILGITQIPGGPHLERMAKEGDAYAHTLPMPLSKTRDPKLQSGCDFSFSGLKTATRTLLEKSLPASKVAEGPEEEVRKKRADVAAVFQRIAVAHLCERADRAVDWALEMEPSVEALVVAGGVAANQTVREGLRAVASCASLEMNCPPPRLCVDNGVMVAWAGIERLRLGLYEAPPSIAGIADDVEIRPRWPLGARDARSLDTKAPKAPKRKKAGNDAAACKDGSEPPAKRVAVSQEGADT